MAEPVIETGDFSMRTAQLFAGGFGPTTMAPRQKEPTTLTKEEAITALWGLALNEPEDTLGELSVQIGACEMMYRTLAYEPALQRLSEVADIDAARTKGRRRDQEAAAKLRKHLASSTKMDRKQRIL
jgi:hypothetical protein